MCRRLPQNSQSNGLRYFRIKQAKGALLLGSPLLTSSCYSNSRFTQSGRVTNTLGARGVFFVAKLRSRSWREREREREKYPLDAAVASLTFMPFWNQIPHQTGFPGVCIEIWGKAKLLWNALKGVIHKSSPTLNSPARKKSTVNVNRPCVQPRSLLRQSGSISVSGQLHTYPSPNPTVILTY